ncbi:MAG: hypothetical protein R3B48_14220 [Kofleriaceae bacterium]
MTVSALVVTLSSDPAVAPQALAALAQDPRLQLGERHAERIPVVAETESPAAGVALCEHLERLAGVLRVDVVAIDFAERA